MWKRIEGSIIFGNLILENDDEAHIVVIKNRKEFDKFLIDKNVTPQDIAWK